MVNSALRSLGHLSQEGLCLLACTVLGLEPGLAPLWVENLKLKESVGPYLAFQNTLGADIFLLKETPPRK